MTRGSCFARVVMTSVPIASTRSSPDVRASELRQLEEKTTSRIIAQIIRYRVRFFPLPILFAVALIWIAPAVWRYVLLGLAITAIAALGWVERVRQRARSSSAEPVLYPMLLGGLAQLMVVLVLGGIAGPVAPALPLIAMIMNVIAPGRQAVVFVTCVQIPVVWLFAIAQAYDLVPDLVPEAWHGLYAPAGTAGSGPWIGAACMSVILIGGMSMGRTVRGVLLDLLREQMEDRDRQLESYDDSARAISRMTAEIAHELKNPLASVKGLAALVRKDLDGTPAERMDVLRREVDRLQGILEEFLSYSRPLVPIDEERVDLVALATEVVELHEGIARQAEVRLLAPRGEVHLRCDPRKIKRVLINLVQNAIEASSRGGEVRVEIARDGEGAGIRVIDAGSGLLEGAAERLFEVGFTTKEEGTGIGLALARGLARQHGGELTLQNREGARGCVATLALPAVPVPQGRAP